jgi:integrase/recombinase XerD
MPARKRPPAAAAAGEASASPARHLAPFLRYLEAECGLAANTVRAYRADLEGFFAWLAARGGGSVHRVDLKLLTQWLADLHERPLAASSVARHLVSLKMFFRYLVLEGILAESAVELLQSPRLWRHLPQVLSPEMVNRLLAAPTLDDRYPFRDRALLALLYATGCRASEVAGLRLRDVHLDEAFCRCTGKGNKERLVSLNPPAVLSVRAYLEHERPQLTAGSDSLWLLITRRGQPVSRVIVWKLVKKYAARIGLARQVSPHTLRHSFATHLLAGGAEIRALQELLGHASIATTQIYTQVEHSRLKAVHQKCHPRG